MIAPVIIRAAYVEFFQFFDWDFPYLVGHRLYHHSQDKVSQMIYVIVIRECWGSASLNFLMTPIPFIALDVFSFNMIAEVERFV